jgi:hypothetical protein
MRVLNYLPWSALGFLMILHGIAHTPAVLGSWGLMNFEDVSHQPNVLLTNAGDNVVMILGGIWLLAALSFVIAGIGVLHQSHWWPTAACTALVLSIAMTMLWRYDAHIGLLLNAIILGILAAMYLASQWHSRKFA